MRILALLLLLTAAAPQPESFTLKPGQAFTLTGLPPLTEMTVTIKADRPVVMGLIDPDLLDKPRVLARLNFATLDCGAVQVRETTRTCRTPRYEHVLFIRDTRTPLDTIIGAVAGPQSAARSLTDNDVSITISYP